MAGALEIGVWCLLFLASVTDVLWGKIFNALTFPFLAVGLSFRFFSFGWEDLTVGLLSVGVALAVFFPLYFSKIMAAGDVKLLMAAGAWLNPSQTLKLAALTIVIGALAGILIRLFRNGLKDLFRSKLTRIPFAPAFLCAFSVLKIAETRGWTFN
ncbi:MAG: prepilin peptidase [Proteobacteria bacterium]|nr:prepilin peptidase [Pseudomonadota bacterium]